MSTRAAAASPGRLLWLCAALLASVGAVGAQSNSLSSVVRPIYAVTEQFLDFIQPYQKAVLLNDVIAALFNGSSSASAKQGNSSTQYTDWQWVARRYLENMMGYCILLFIGLLCILLVPLGGLVTCCCRCCCHRCGGKGSRMERRGSAWRRGCYGFLLIVLLVVMALGVILAFISNQLIREQMTNSTQNETLLSKFSSSLNDIAGHLDDIPGRARANSASALANLVGAVQPAADASARRLRSLLGVSSKADSALQTAQTTVLQASLAANFAKGFVDNHDSFSDSLRGLRNMLTYLKANLSEVDANCPLNAVQADCDFIARQLPGLEVSQNALNTGLPNVTSLNSQLSRINVTSLQARLTSMQKSLDNVSNVALQFIASNIADAQNSLNSSSQLEVVWSTVEKLFTSLSGFISNSTFNVNSLVNDPLTQTNKPLGDVVAGLDTVRFVIYLAIASLASLILLLWFLGVSYGFCGEPPYEDARCCNRGFGACLLMTGTAISFICYAVLFICILLLFLTGGIADTEVCRYLTGRAGSDGYRLLDKSLNQVIQATTPDLSRYSLNLVSGLLDGCRENNNASITAALNIQNLVQSSDIDAVVKRFINHTRVQLQSRRADLVSGVALDLNLTEVEAISVAASSVSLDSFIAELLKPMISSSERVFAAIQNISVSASRSEDKTRFRALVAFIDSASTSADAMVQLQLGNLLRLRSALAQMSTSASGITANLLSAHSLVQTPLTVELAIGEATTTLTSMLQVSLRNTIAIVISASADCGTLNKKLLSLVNAPCSDFLKPFNGFWTGMGVFLICLLPCLVLTVKLSNLYRKTHKYQADYIDSEFMNPSYVQFYRISTFSNGKSANDERRTSKRL